MVLQWEIFMGLCSAIRSLPLKNTTNHEISIFGAYPHCTPFWGVIKVASFGPGLFTLGKGEDMATIQPKGEPLRQAVKWISAQRQQDEGKALTSLIQEAALRFNLSPKDEEFLRGFYREGEG